MSFVMKIVGAAGLSIISVMVFNATPAGWFADYDEPVRLERGRRGRRGRRIEREEEGNNRKEKEREKEKTESEIEIGKGRITGSRRNREKVRRGSVGRGRISRERGCRRISILPAGALFVFFYLAPDPLIVFFLGQLAIADICYYILPDQWILAIAGYGILKNGIKGCILPQIAGKTAGAVFIEKDAVLRAENMIQEIAGKTAEKIFRSNGMLLETARKTEEITKGVLQAGTGNATKFLIEMERRSAGLMISETGKSGGVGIGVESAANEAAGMLIGMILPLVLWFAGAAVAAIIKRPPPFGFGDAKLFSALGLVMGAAGALQLFAIACIAAGAAALLIIAKKQRALPFAPFVMIGYIMMELL